MPANVESMMYVSNEKNGRFVPWHGLGTPVAEALSSKEAIKMAGLDWTVEARPVYTDALDRKLLIPNIKANVRSTDNKVLGLVTDRYKIVQNKDAFDFTDSLIGPDCKYETAGSLMDGKKVWLLARMPETKVLGDAFDPYICFTNTHDGSGSIKVCCTNVRVVCQNTLNMALNGAKRMWSTRHLGDLKSKMEFARQALELAGLYNEQFAKFAEKAANTKITEDKQQEIIATLFPIVEDETDRKKNNVMKDREKFEQCVYALDLRAFYGTLWGLLNAASDFSYHCDPNRVTNGLQESRMNKCIEGTPMLEKIMELCPVE